MTLEEDVTEIKINVAKIVEHIKVLNDKIKRHEDMLTRGCNIRHKKIDEDIEECKKDVNKSKLFEARISTAIIVVLTILNVIVYIKQIGIK